MAGVQEGVSAGVAGKRKQQPPARKRGSVTLALLVLTPLLIAFSGWLAQPLNVLWLALATVLSLVVLCTAWALCGAGPGACVAVTGFALMLFLGPTLDEIVIEQRGVRHQGMIVDVDRYKRTSRPTRHTCQVATVHAGRIGVSCTQHHRVDDLVAVVVDPEDWLPARLAEKADGPSTATLWTCAGLFAALEAFILWGRLRRRTA
ncbi:hypothetical protein [Streptomyces sp. NPDC051211]|uniref:hypothetical protein n=1 Tax=Streptomyces sp. NPDC051211 TaxID=3154643 RepID=UPI00344E72B5